MNEENIPQLPRGEIMVVEDNPSDRKFLADILTKAGYRVRPAADGELALRSVRARLPDLILMDINLPGVTGVEVCRRLKTDSRTVDVPVIFISALGKIDMKVKALEAGGIDYVSKPIEPQEVLARISTHLKLYRLHQELADRSASLSAEIEERKYSEEKTRAALKEKETLLREIHHRVKNNMMTISSLLDLQIARSDDHKTREALQDSQSRLQTMSMIHETLYRSDNRSSIDMKTYLSELGNTIFQSYAVRDNVTFKNSAENMLIEVKRASLLGMIVNELITNSLKYAFPNDKKGEIVLELKSNKENGVELTVSDNGIGMPEGFNFQDVDSLGLKLVKIITEDQLNGSVKMENKNGTKFIIKFNSDKD